jgi:hypothetical protein
VSRQACSCGGKQRYRGVRTRNLLTVAGDIVVPRRYFACDCGQTHSPMDAWAGIGARSVSEEARRLIVLAGSSWSFQKAADKLQEFCRLKVSNDTVRAVCDEEGKKVGQWISRDQASVREIKTAAGEWEFSSDGTCVNTTEGWREMRLSVLSKRETAMPAGPESWDDRVLPAPTARLAWSAIADSHKVGKSWKRMFKHAGIHRDAILSVIADGAKWIWEQVALHLPSASAQWVLDVYHASQHIHACGKQLFGENNPAGKTWSNQRLMQLIQHGGPWIIEQLQQELGRQVDPGCIKALRSLLGYLTDNRDRMWYRQRLENGRPIGSGLIEGGCKNTIGARLKLNAARWRVERAEHMGHLRCLEYSELWTSYWNQRAA